ncbi:MAG: PIG-L deacetylase family protein [Coriobacteriia bacterium]
MNLLVVVAHPDDEVLGAGATSYKLAGEGHSVSACILSGEAVAREGRPGSDELQRDLYSAARIVGIGHVIAGDFPNIEFNTVPHLKVVRFIESAIEETKADVILTHHPADLNNDHLHTSIACQAAARLFQRRTQTKPLSELLFMEVASATEWALNSGMNRFTPNTFMEVGLEAIEKKIEALAQYRGVMRPFPHPRCSEALRALAAYRGSQAGMVFAESFESVFRRGF